MKEAKFSPFPLVERFWDSHLQLEVFSHRVTWLMFSQVIVLVATCNAFLQHTLCALLMIQYLNHILFALYDIRMFVLQIWLRMYLLRNMDHIIFLILSFFMLLFLTLMAISLSSCRFGFKLPICAAWSWMERGNEPGGGRGTSLGSLFSLDIRMFSLLVIEHRLLTV
jgi:hypothetical protein